MLECQMKVLNSCSNRLLDDILADNPKRKKNIKKRKKIAKNRLLGLMSRSKLSENGPEIVEKKIHYCT